MNSFNPRNPAKYQGTDKTITFFVTRERSPTGADYRQPETGRLYTIGTIWQVGKDPSDGTEGDLWILSKIVANVGYWVQFGSGVGPSGAILTLSDTAGTLVYPTGAGNIQLYGTAGQIDITADPGNNRLIFGLSGGGAAIDSIQVDAVTAPGVNPVVPDVNGLMTVSGNIVDAHSVPMQTRSVAVNAYRIDAQVTSTVTGTPANKNAVGMAQFESTQFSANSDGYVTLVGSGGGPPTLSLTGDDATPISPDGTGTINLHGTVVTSATHAKPLYFKGTAISNLIEADIQLSQTVPYATATTALVGLAQFNDAQFQINSYGTISLFGSTSINPILQVETDSGDGNEALPDSDGEIKILGGADISVTNSGNTLTVAYTGSNSGGTETSVFLYDDFMGDASTGGATENIGQLNWRSLNMSVDPNDTWGITSGHPGTLHCISSNSNPSQVYLQLGYNVGFTGTATIKFLFKLNNLSDGVTYDYDLRVGIGGQKAGSTADPNDHIQFAYTHNVNSGNYVISCSSGGSATTQNTSSAASTDWTELRLDIVDGTSVDFYIDGIQVGTTISTDIPSTYMDFRIYMTGTGSASMEFDYFLFQATYPSRF